MPDDRLLTKPFVLVSLANVFNGLSFNLFLHFPGYLQDLGAAEVAGLNIHEMSLTRLAGRHRGACHREQEQDAQLRDAVATTV